MAALLRSGKFLRVVSGLARQGNNNNGQTQGPTSGFNGLGQASASADPFTSSLVPSLELGQGSGPSGGAWSLQLLEGSLPALGVEASANEDKDRDRRAEVSAYGLIVIDVMKGGNGE